MMQSKGLRRIEVKKMDVIRPSGHDYEASQSVERK